MRLAYEVDAPVCHLGVDCESFRPIRGINKENSLVSVGEMTPRKGFDFLIESIGCLPSGRRPVLTLICNWQSADERDYLRDLAVQHGVELRVLANLDATQLAVEYNKAKLCVYAPVMEPFGLVPLESMACGTPVVGVREGGVCESVIHNETGLLVTREPDLFADAIATLLDDDSRRVQLSRHCRAYVEERWRWERSVHALERHLENAAREKWQ